MISQAFITSQKAIMGSPVFPPQLSSESPEMQRKLSKRKHNNNQIKHWQSGHGDYFSQIK